MSSDGTHQIPSELALRLGQLALTPSTWIHRRVERVVYLDESTVRRYISIDFTVPGTHQMAGSEAVAFVPLGLFAKHKLTSFDLRDATGAALPMLTSAENGVLSSAVLLAVGQARLGWDLDSIAEQYIPRLVFSTADRERELATDRILRPGTHAGERILQQRGFVTLVGDLAENFMLYLPTEGKFPGERVIVKISYDSPRQAPRLSGIAERLGFTPARDGFDVPPVGYGASYHFELEAPRDMEIVSGAFLAARNGGLISDSVRGPVRKAHFNLSDVDRGFGLVWLGLTARSGALLSGTALFTTVNVLALAFVCARIDKVADVTGSGGREAAVAALLAVPALLIGYLLRPGEHEILSAFLALPRRASLVSALTSLLAAGLLFGGYSPSTLRVLYAGLASVAGICALIAVLGWLRQRH